MSEKNYTSFVQVLFIFSETKKWVC